MKPGGKLWFQLPFISRVAKNLHYAFEQLLLRLPFDRFVAVSHHTEARLIEEKVSPERISMFYNGIDYAEFEVGKIEDQRIDADSPFQFIFLGRLGISKGLDLLLPAAKKLAEERSGWNLQLIVPKKPQHIRSWLEDFVKKNHLNEFVQIRDSLAWELLKKTIRSSDAVVIPSYREGFCFVAVETMALGTPIISSQQGALAEVVGGNLLEMNQLDSDILVDLMQKAMDGKWEIKPQRKFPLAPQIDAYVSLYQELLGS